MANETVVVFADKFENAYVEIRYEWFIVFYTATVVITCKSGYAFSNTGMVSYKKSSKTNNVSSE